MNFSIGTIVRLVLLVLATSTNAQSANVSNVAYWLNPRGAIIQRTLVVEGGMLARGSYTNGKFSNINITGNAHGLLYYMDLGTSFNTSTDAIDTLMEPVNESDTLSMKNWIGGGLFATEYEWYTFG